MKTENEKKLARRDSMPLTTRHKILFGAAADRISDIREPVHLIVTSPPYPMIAMWDDIFSTLSPKAASALRKEDAATAFEAMHQILDPVWKALYRMLSPGGIACINIGDAVRTMKGNFVLWPNHSRIQSAMTALGFTSLPAVIWRKPTTAPNKFMGSGMLPPSAYVTLEHEYILVFRKGEKRAFSAKQKENRRKSACFWEERNHWFSDIWTGLTGERQSGISPEVRKRSGAYPFEVPYRLISMFSVYGDRVVDPFLGTGTTSMAAAAAGRHSTGIELHPEMEDLIRERMAAAAQMGKKRITDRLNAHAAFVDERQSAGKAMKHGNTPYGFPVITAQEKELTLYFPAAVEETGPMEFETSYRDPSVNPDWSWQPGIPMDFG